VFLGAFRIAIWPEEDGSIRELLRTYRLCLALMREVLGREGRMVQDSTSRHNMYHYVEGPSRAEDIIFSFFNNNLGQKN